MALDTRHSTFVTRLRAYLELARPANVITAWADILAGVAFAYGTSLIHQENSFFISLADADVAAIGWLLLATTSLYAGGVVMNDVFDFELDKVERPERAIPSGRASRTGAAVFGITLIVLGVLAAWQASTLSAMLAFGIGILALLYDRVSKHHSLFGPINMGLCRAGNLLLGVSITPFLVEMYWGLGLIPLMYIGAITAISQGEVHGGSTKKGWLAVGLVSFILVVLIGQFAYQGPSLLWAAAFILFFVWLVMPSFLRAARKPEAMNIRRAVRAGILGLIPLNAAIAAGFAGWSIGIIVLLLLPISIGLARLFAVT